MTTIVNGRPDVCTWLQTTDVAWLVPQRQIWCLLRERDAPSTTSDTYAISFRSIAARWIRETLSPRFRISINSATIDKRPLIGGRLTPTSSRYFATLLLLYLCLIRERHVARMTSQPRGLRPRHPLGGTECPSKRLTSTLFTEVPDLRSQRDLYRLSRCWRHIGFENNRGMEINRNVRWSVRFSSNANKYELAPFLGYSDETRLPRVIVLGWKRGSKPPSFFLLLCFALDKSCPYGAVIETARVSRDMRRANGSIVSYEGRRKGKGKTRAGRIWEFVRLHISVAFLRAESIIMVSRFDAGMRDTGRDRVRWSYRWMADWQERNDVCRSRTSIFLGKYERGNFGYFR